MKVLNDKDYDEYWEKNVTNPNRKSYSEQWIVKFWILNSKTLFWNQLKETYYTEDKDMYDEVKEKWEQDCKGKKTSFVSIKYQ